MGISEDADTVKLNTIEKTEHLTIKKAYLEGEEGNFWKLLLSKLPSKELF